MHGSICLHVCARVHACVSVCVYMCFCMRVCGGVVSPVNVGLAEDGFQAVVKLKEGHVLGERARYQGSPCPWGDTLPSPLSLFSTGARTRLFLKPLAGGGWRGNIQNQRSLALRGVRARASSY